MVENHLEIGTMNSGNISDRLKLCWGHLNNWKNLEVVKKSRDWLVETNAVFAPTTFIAYKRGVPIGMIEIVPLRLLKSVRLCPCRVDERKGEVEERYILREDSDNCLFISCLLVNKDQQGKGVGRALLNHFLNSEVLEDYDGALVYVTKRDERWDKHIHWPAGPKEFYLKAGFTTLKTLENPAGCLLSYRR